VSDKFKTDLRNPEMFAAAPVARQVQAAREAQGAGRLVARATQKPCDAGLFAPAAPPQDDLFSI
jgi:hypothetical protein